MNIDDARKVLWLKSNPRPLGELLDEGYLTKERLEWAVQWAYSYTLQRAAKVLLENTKFPEKQPNRITEKLNSKQETAAAPIKIGISLEKARATLWPFSPYKGEPMGGLVDSKQLALKDLAYAAENAWDQKVRQAAIALSLVRLEQVVKEPVPSAGFVQVVSGGRSYSERRQHRLTFLQGIVVGLMISVLLLLLSWTIYEFLRPRPNAKPISELISSPIQITALVILLGLTVFGGWLVAAIPEWISKGLDKQIEDHRRGQEGEDRTVQLILQALDGTWHLFRNIELPGRSHGDLDTVLVGPSGVWALEIKAFRGIYRNIGENWEYKRGKKWLRHKKSPSRQARDNAVRLANFLRADHVNVFVNSAVVWANPESPLTIENPSTAVWLLDRLPDELGNIWHEKRVPESEQKKIVEKLTRLCERQREAQKQARG